jgi:hypothetical protein
MERVECRVDGSGSVTSHSLSSSTSRRTRGRRRDEPPLPLSPPPAPPGSAPAAQARQARQCRAVRGPRRLGHHAAQPRQMYERRRSAHHGPLPVPCFAYVRDVRGGGRGGATCEALEPHSAKRTARPGLLTALAATARVHGGCCPTEYPAFLVNEFADFTRQRCPRCPRGQSVQRRDTVPAPGPPATDQIDARGVARLHGTTATN